MAVCANCEHDVKAHGGSGCIVGSALKDASQHCHCPLDFYQVDLKEESVERGERCRTCNHTYAWHHAEDPAARCSRCDACDGFLTGQSGWMDPCPAQYLNAVQSYRCRRKADHDGVHAEGSFRWANHTPKEQNVTYEDAKPTANPDRVKASDSQVGGEHYRQTGIQPWDIIDAWGLDFYAGNALKYLYRAGRKGPKVEDLKKARHYIDKMIEKEES